MRKIYRNSSQEEFCKRLKLIFNVSDIKILSLYSKNAEKIYVKTEFGICKVIPNNLLSGSKPSISSAICKTSYWKNLYRSKYKKTKLNLSKVNYTNTFTKIIVSDKFGELSILPSTLLKGDIPNIRASLNKTQYWINKAKIIHKERYDYSLVKFSESRDKFTIICKNHGLFKQLSTSHLQGQGCKKCQDIRIKRWNQKYSLGGWSLTAWKNSALISKEFDNFKIYIIEIIDKNEHFYKIGRTFKKTKSRLSLGETKTFPYRYKIIKEYSNSAEKILKLEKQLKNNNKKHFYKPKKSFFGMCECFNNLTIETWNFIKNTNIQTDLHI